jgi:hypothetical protein
VLAGFLGGFYLLGSGYDAMHAIFVQTLLKDRIDAVAPWLSGKNMVPLSVCDAGQA